MVRGTWSASRVTTDELYLLPTCSRQLGFLSSYDRDCGVPLELKEVSQAFYHVVAGVPLECNGDIGVPLELKQGNWASSRVVRGSLGVLPRHYRGIGPCRGCSVKLRELYLMQQETGLFQDAMGNLVFLLITMRAQSSC